ncbi:hypothetical protein FSP39_011149 [Pinctada imbricata]|uniref:Uncharacterized protein n=1 Tax=Pinctada imbricata TaxID=66713 RepID=A0AA88YTU4_PINIB|nr:hypothetical protein FSP39_011149 [Pinctada imbricata]
MCKLDKICKKDSKAILDRDVALRNQFAENVYTVWLRRELKKGIRGTPSISFTDLREEATLLMEDSHEGREANEKQQSPEFDAPVLATSSKGTEDLTKVISDLTNEVQNLKSTMQAMQNAAPQEYGQFTYRPRQPECFYCGRPGYFKRTTQKRSKRGESTGEDRKFKRAKPAAMSRLVGQNSLGSHSNVVKKMVANSPILSVKIKDTVVQCILDTGSVVSTITESFYNKHLKSKFEMHPEQNWLRLRAANGLEIPYVGYIESDVYIPSVDKTVKERGILIIRDPPGRSRNETTPGLIGMNIIAQCSDILKTQIGNMTSASSELKGFARVAGNSEICIPANSVSVIWTNPQNCKRKNH